MEDLKKIDSELCDVARQITLIRHINPTNTDEEEIKFFKSNTYNPVFTYQDFDAKNAGARLKALEPDNSEIGKVLESVRDFMLRLLRAMENRGAASFTDPGLYGMPSKKLVDAAYEILNTTHALPKEPLAYSAEQLKGLLQDTIDMYGFERWEFVLDPNARATFVDPCNRKVIINPTKKFSEKRARRLQVHEVGTHVLRSMNGYNQEYKIFGTDMLPGALPTEEGLAVIHEMQAGVSDQNIERICAGRVIAVSMALESSFREVYDELVKYFEPKQTFNITARAKRGLSDTSKPGGFIKDHAYFEGRMLIQRYLDNGGDLTPLYAAKIGLQHKYLVEIGALKPAKFLPRFTSRSFININLKKIPFIGSWASRFTE